MARSRKLGDFIYNYVLDHFIDLHELINTPTVVRLDIPRYRNIAEIIRGILEDPVFFDVDDYHHHKTPSEGQIEVSKNTIRGAINRLIEDKKIANIDGYWEYVPDLETKLNDMPILRIATQTKITVNVPESYLVLTVSNGLANSVAEYLAAQFHQGDIIFIPVGNHIFCISTLPKSHIDSASSKEPASDISPTAKLHYRVTSVLHDFDIQYPQFTRGINYETAYTAVHNPKTNAEIRQMAFDYEKDKFSYHRYMTLMKMFKSLPWLEEYQTLSTIFGPPSTKHDGIDDEEWELMNSPIMDIVDNGFEE